MVWFPRKAKTPLDRGYRKSWGTTPGLHTKYIEKGPELLQKTIGSENGLNMYLNPNVHGSVLIVGKNSTRGYGGGISWGITPGLPTKYVEKGPELLHSSAARRSTVWTEGRYRGGSLTYHTQLKSFAWSTGFDFGHTDNIESTTIFQWITIESFG
jgi:hypothetical protein